MDRKNKVVIIIPVILLLVGLVFLLSVFYVSNGSSNQASTSSSPGYNTSTQSATGVISTGIQNGASINSNPDNIYIIAGGQNGSWFKPAQYPRLYQIFLSNGTSKRLDPVPSKGTVWSGDWNGSIWLISGWGENDSLASPSNPYLDLFNGTVLSDNPSNVSQEAEWDGGDIFASSSNGTDWFVSGLGSGVLPSYNKGVTNHFSAGLFNGTTFTDLSSELPQQWDGILYSNAYNGSEWLVGGGWNYAGVLFAFNGTRFTDLTTQLESKGGHSGSITSIGWNGQYWLIGGTGFLAMYNGSSFTDLTNNLNQSVNLNEGQMNGMDAVNAIAWNGTTWLLGGGTPVADDTGPSSAWLAAFNSTTFTNLTSDLPDYAVHPSVTASILTIAPYPIANTWVIGGYSNNQSMLLTFNGGISDYSNLVNGSTYVDWVGVAP